MYPGAGAWVHIYVPRRQWLGPVLNQSGVLKFAAGACIHIVYPGAGSCIHIVYPGAGTWVHIVNPGAGACIHIVYPGAGAWVHIMCPGAGAWVHILAPFAPSVTRLYCDCTRCQTPEERKKLYF